MATFDNFTAYRLCALETSTRSDQATAKQDKLRMEGTTNLFHLADLLFETAMAVCTVRARFVVVHGADLKSAYLRR
jgi:hypothetical protein